MIDLILTLAIVLWVIYSGRGKANLRAHYWPGMALSLDELNRQRSAQRCNCEECE